MSFITAEMSAVVTDLATAGIPATSDPGAVYTMVSGSPTVALVTPPDEIRISLGVAAVSFDLVVWLLTRPPDDLAAQDRLGDGLVAAIPAAVPLDLVERQQWVGSDGVELPAFRWPTGRSMPYPT